MSIEKDVQRFIFQNSKVKLGSDGLIGNKIIIIYGGDSSKPKVVSNDYLSVEKELTTNDMMATLQVTNTNLLEITNAFKRVSKKIDSGKGTLSILLNNEEIANQLKSTVAILHSTLSNFQTASVTSKNILSDFKGISSNLNNPGNSVYNLSSDTILYTTIRRTLSELENATTSVSKFSLNIQKESENLSKKDNIVGVLLNDSTAASSIQMTLKNLEASSQKLDADLEALQHNFFLRGFFRRKEKAKN